MRAGQVEAHLASCSACYQRFEAWSDAVETFTAMAPPAPPPPPPDRRPLLALAAFVGLSFIVVSVGVVAAVVSTGDRAEQSSAFAMQTPSVKLIVGGRTDIDVSALTVGTLIQVRYDSKNARYVGLGLRTSGGPHVLLVGEVPDPSVEQLAPLELLHEVDHRTLFVVISDRTLVAEDVLAVIGGTPAPDVSVAVVPL